MPDYCNNNLSITGDIEQLKQFACRHIVFDIEQDTKRNITMDDLECGKEICADLDCHSIIPTPEELKIDPHDIYLKSKEEIQAIVDQSKSHAHLMQTWEQQRANIKKYGYPNWYEFQCEQWGSKWGAFDGSMAFDSKTSTLYLNYATAWSPIIAVIKKLIEMYPQLCFECEYDDGCTYEGVISGSNGLVTQDECWDLEDEED